MPASRLAASWTVKARLRDGSRTRFHGSARAAARHDIYNPMCCPTGKTREPWVNARRRKYSTLPKFGNGVFIAASRPNEEGRIAIVTNAGRAAVDAGHIGAKDFAGRATVSETPRAHDRCDRRTAKSCGPDARGLCVKLCGDAAARPGAHIDHPQGDGGNSATLPGEEHEGHR
jgi:hypothetical protein